VNGAPGGRAPGNHRHSAPDGNPAAVNSRRSPSRRPADSDRRRCVWNADRRVGAEPCQRIFPVALRHYPRLRPGHWFYRAQVYRVRCPPWNRGRARCLLDVASPRRGLADRPMTSMALAWRTATAERARAVLALIGVTVIGALLFDMLLLSRGLLVSFRELLDSTGYDVRVTATDSVMFRAPIRPVPGLARDTAALREVKDGATLRRELGNLQADAKHRDVTVLSVSPGAERQAWRIVSGMGFSPEARLEEPPLIVSRRLAE